MSYSFVGKSWTISGEQNFGEFSLLNPTITIQGLIISEKAQLVVSAKENGGVYNHTVNMFYENAELTDVNEIVDKIMSEAFPEAEPVD